MQKIVLENLIKEIVVEASLLRDVHTDERGAFVNYAAVFAQNANEFASLLATMKTLGTVIQETPTGPLFLIPPLETVSGILRLVKIRQPDKTRPERVDADFTVKNFGNFKNIFLSKPGFSLIKRPTMEIIELIDPKFSVRAYFSDPPLDQQLGISWLTTNSGVL